LLAVPPAGVAVIATADAAGAAVTVPNPPTNVSSIPSGSTGATLYFTPGNNGHATVDHFTVEYYIGGVDKGVLTTVAGPDGGMTHLTGLTTGVSYQFAVSAHNSVGDGALSKKSVATRVGAPSAPTCCSSAKRVAAGSIKLKFVK